MLIINTDIEVMDIIMVMEGIMDMEVIGEAIIIGIINPGNSDNMGHYLIQEMFMRVLHYLMKFQMLKNKFHLQDYLEFLKKDNPQENLQRKILLEENCMLVKLFNTLTQIDIILFLDQGKVVFQLISLTKFIFIWIQFLYPFKKE